MTFASLVSFAQGLTYSHWFVLGSVLLILEIFTPTFYLIWPGIAAVVVGVLMWFVPDLSWMFALSLFAVISVASTVIWHSLYRRSHRVVVDGMALNQRADRYIGRRAIVAEAFRSGRGPIFLDDTRWPAVSESGLDLAPGAAVEIIGADGTTLRVRTA